MSRISEVIKNKNNVEKSRKARRKNEMQLLRNKSEFKARLYDEMKHIEAALHDDNIEAIIVTVPDTSLAQFSASIYSEDLADYNVEQVEDQPNQFLIRRKFLAF